MLNEINIKIVPYIKEILDYKFGLRQESAIVTPLPADLYYEDGYNGFIFTLPRRQKIGPWQFIFDLENLYSPPDIISEDNFYECFDSKNVQKTVPSLGNWDPTNAKCVLQLVIELLQLYQKYQLNILYKHNALKDYQHHYDCLKKEISSRDIEVDVSVSNPRVASVQFCVGFKFNLSDLPISESVAQSHVAWLFILYQTTGAIPNITIKLHEKLEELIGTQPLCSDAMRIKFEVIIENVQLALEHEIRKFRQNLLKRRDLCYMLMTDDALQILETDELFSKVSFHIKRDKKNFVCQLMLPFTSTGSAQLIIIKGKPQPIADFTIHKNDDIQKVANYIVQECRKELLRPSELGPTC